MPAPGAPPNGPRSADLGSNRCGGGADPQDSAHISGSAAPLWCLEPRHAQPALRIVPFDGLSRRSSSVEADRVHQYDPAVGGDAEHLADERAAYRRMSANLVRPQPANGRHDCAGRVRVYVARCSARGSGGPLRRPRNAGPRHRKATCGTNGTFGASGRLTSLRALELQRLSATNPGGSYRPWLCGPRSELARNPKWFESCSRDTGDGPCHSTRPRVAPSLAGSAD